MGNTTRRIFWIAQKWPLPAEDDPRRPRRHLRHRGGPVSHGEGAHQARDPLARARPVTPWRGPGRASAGGSAGEAECAGTGEDEHATGDQHEPLKAGDERVHGGDTAG